MATLIHSLRKVLALAVVLAGIGTSHQALAQAGSINDDIIALTLKPSGQAAQPTQNYAGSDNTGAYSYTAFLGSTDDTSVPVPQLGTYDLNGSSSSSLVISGASLSGTRTSNNTTVAVTRLQYRVYLSGTTDAMKPNYTNFTLTTTQAPGTTANLGFSGTGSMTADMLSGLTSGGTYVLDIRFQADLVRNSTLRPITDLTTGGFFYANFYVTPPSTTPPGGTTTWQSTLSNGASTDWALASNWSNGVPTRFSNAIIPPKNQATYVYPVLNSPTALYEVNNLTLQGNGSSSQSQVTINTATLRVYGNISQVAGGLVGNTTGTTGVTDPINNSTLVLAGADQIITGNLVVSDIIVAGTGTKSVINQLTPSNILAFQPTNVANGVIIQSAAQDVSNGTVNTVFDTTGNSYIQLLASSIISTVGGQAETNTSYIKGVTRADRQVNASATFGTPTTTDYNTFGNIGLDIRANHTPGTIVVYRVVGDALTGPVNATAVPIKRQYRVQGDDNSNNTAFSGSRIDVIFHYLNSSDELNGIAENNLTMFRTVTNGAPYQQVQGTLNTTNKTVTRLVLNSLTNFTLTLGDRTNPLPVSLSAFSAIRANGNANLAWTTSSEQNNAGFEVQVSTNAIDFRKLTFVASKSANSVQTQNYSYVDTEANKSGIRYYRLRQVDISGEASYSPVRALSFDGAATATDALVAYPNPFVDKLDFNLDASKLADGKARVQLVDMAGRTVREQTLSVSNASVTLAGLDGLRSGLYLAKITLSDGSIKTVRIQKQ